MTEDIYTVKSNDKIKGALMAVWSGFSIDDDGFSGIVLISISKLTLGGWGTKIKIFRTQYVTPYS